MRRIFFILFILFSVSMYAESIRLIHEKITTAKSDEPILVKTNAINIHLINYIILHYKGINSKRWSEAEMMPLQGSFEATIPVETVEINSKDGLVYYIEVIDINGKSESGFASQKEPQYILIEKSSGDEDINIGINGKEMNDTNINISDELATFVDDEDDFNAKKVTLASGKEESIIGTPFSVTVITQKEIETSGATSIAEIFRLVPGMIVREQTAGNYDVHIRGFDNVPPNSFLTISSNMLTLLMINNRVVYDYQLGGIFWDALPIDIQDIERIEIVRGPAAAMYGPSAASGVINIITKKVTDKKRYLGWANISRGNNKSIFFQAIAGHYQEINGNRKLGIVVSGNYQNRGRFNRKIWSWAQDPKNPRNGQYVEPEVLNSINSNYKQLPSNLFVAVQYPYPETGVNRRGFNANVTYDLNKNISLQVDAGAQDSIALKPYQETVDSFLLTHESKTQYINARLKLWDFSTRVSYNWGEQPIKGHTAMSGDIGILNTSMEYNLKFLKDFEVKAIANYNNIQYGALSYGGEKYKVAKFENLGLSLRTEANFLNRSLKFVAAGRLDMFAHLKKNYFTFQLASVYNYKNKFVVRGVYSRANRNPFLGPTFYQVRNLDANNPTIYLGNSNLKLVTIDLLEFGTRFNFNKIANLDLELFYTTGKDFSHFVPTGDVIVIDGVSRAKVVWSQLELKARQYGATFSTSLSFKKIRTKFFITLQKTMLDDYNSNWFDMGTAHLNDPGKTIEHLDTPKYYGGGYLNIGEFYKMNLNISTYYFGKQEYHHVYDTAYISSKVLVNLKLSYNVTKRAQFYFNARNLLNNKSREFGWADESGGLYIAGFVAKF